MKGLLKFLRVLIGIAVAAGVIAAIAYFVTHSKPVIYDLRAYLEHSVTGYDGEAVMDVSVNKNNLAEDILPQLKKKDREAYEALTTAMGSGQSSEFIDTLFEMKVSQTENLSNGDVVSVDFTYDNAFLAGYGVEFTGDHSEITVENLKEIVKVDYLKDVELSFAGVSPYLSTDERIFTQLDDAYVVCSVEPYEHLKSGEKVTVTIDTEESEFPEGVRPEKESMQYTVADADAFVTEVSELSDNDVKRIRKQCKHILTEDQAFRDYDVWPEPGADASFWIDPETVEVSNIKVTNQTELYMDDGSLDSAAAAGDETPNVLALIYECDVTNQNPIDPYNGGTYHVYGTILAGNLVRSLDGNLTYDVMKRFAGEQAFHLYASMDDLQKQLDAYVGTLGGNLKLVSDEQDAGAAKPQEN